MIKFYSNIADYYDYIFPYNPIHNAFALNCINRSTNNNLLDIGCGTGNLSLKLTKSFNSVTGIDLDSEMIKRADLKTETLQNIHFSCMNMMDINDVFGNNSFDSIISFGNTLVHLTDLDMFSQFFANVRKSLKPSCRLLIQIINYDRILKENIKALSTIENEHIMFKRKYNYIKKQNNIEFITELTVKKTGKILNNKVNLYPLLKSELHCLLQQNNFANISFYGSFKKDELTGNSIPLIVEAY